MANHHQETYVDISQFRTLRRRLLAWYRKNARDLPWRRTNDPYRVWISEIMLQQTQVETVIPYYRRFLKQFPNVRRLAAADESQVLRLWEGLGYYRRARQLHQAAQIICNEQAGVFPNEFRQVESLPGIGRYTAGAILSFAHDQRQPILEANTIRLYCRLLGYHGDPTKSAGQKVLWQFASDVLPAKGSSQVNQALMEFGSQICRATDPSCDQCPLTSVCRAFENGEQASVPISKKKMAYEPITEVAVVIRHRGRVLLRKCGEGERWAGLWDYPRFSWDAGNPVLQTSRPTKRGVARRSAGAIEHEVRRLTGLAVECGTHLSTIRHGVTKYRITLHCFEASKLANSAPRRKSEKLKSTCRWVSSDEIESYPLSTTGRKISRLL